jgi:PLP dependent protein
VTETPVAGSLAERYADVRADITAAARDAGRSPDSLTTIVVTKFHPAELVRELARLGVRDVGENRHQEAAAKARDVADLSMTWHFIGQLQANKAAAALDYASVLHSLDRPSLLDAIAKAAKPVEAFIQLNLTDDHGRGGVDPDRLEEFAERVLAVPNVTLLGLMAVAPLGVDARAAFAGVRELSNRLQTVAPGARALSMGMSGDYREAILEGATHLRIGTAITGNRPPHG